MCRAGRSIRKLCSPSPQPHLQPQELLKRWLASVCPYHRSYPLGEASVSGDSHHLRLPKQVILPTPVTANTGPPVSTLASSLLSLSLLSFQPSLLAPGSWVRFRLWENQWQWSGGWWVFTLKRKPGLPSPASPHPTPVCFSLAGLPLLPWLPAESVPPVFQPILQPSLCPRQQPLCLSPLHVHLRPPGGSSQCPQPDF